jgi:hypothetical protein
MILRPNLVEVCMTFIFMCLKTQTSDQIFGDVTLAQPHNVASQKTWILHFSLLKT